MSAATNYVQCMDDSYNYFSQEDPFGKSAGYAAKVADKSTRLCWYPPERLSFVIRQDATQISVTCRETLFTTDSLLKGMDENTNSEQEENQCLEMLYFQFGRYLLISSSREGSLPANLQGSIG